MKHEAFILLIVVANISCQHHRTSDCTNFKDGTFTAHSELDNMTYSITRKDSSQIETSKETGNTTEWKVTWLDDCEYSLLLLNDNYGLLKSGKLKTVPFFTYKIIRTTDQYYIFENRYDPSKPLLIDTIWKGN